MPGPGRSSSPPQPNAASYAAGVPAGRPPITDRIGLAPFGTLRLASTSPPSLITATWERLRWTSIPTWTDIEGLLPELVCHPETTFTGLSREGGPACRPVPHRVRSEVPPEELHPFHFASSHFVSHQ